MNSSLIRRVKDVDDSAFRKLWQELQVMLERYANRCYPHTSHDGEDAVQSAMVSFWKGLVNRRFDFEDESGVVRLLFTLVRRKVIKQIRKKNTERRGGGVPHVPLEPADDEGFGIDPVDPQLTPAGQAEAKDELRRLFSLLDDAELQRIVILKMDGHTDEAVADALERARVTVVRRLGLIRRIWLTDAQENA